MNAFKKHFNPFKEGAQKCWFLLIMALFSFGLLALLNLYIGKEALKYYTDDGWSFLGGIFISLFFVITIPVLIFSIRSVSLVRKGHKNKHIFPLVLGIAGIISGLILSNATELWIYIIAYSILLLISRSLCKRKKK